MTTDRYQHADQDRWSAIAQIRQGADLEELLISLYERENDRDLDRDPLSYTFGILEEACVACDMPVDKAKWNLLLCGPAQDTTEPHAWLGPDLAAKVETLTPAASHALLHYLLGFLAHNEDFKRALEVAALEGKL